jgi:hypothetical protein
VFIHGAHGTKCKEIMVSPSEQKINQCTSLGIPEGSSHNLLAEGTVLVVFGGVM